MKLEWLQFSQKKTNYPTIARQTAVLKKFFKIDCNEKVEYENKKAGKSVSAKQINARVDAIQSGSLLIANNFTKLMKHDLKMVRTVKLLYRES